MYSDLFYNAEHTRTCNNVSYYIGQVYGIVNGKLSIIHTTREFTEHVHAYNKAKKIYESLKEKYKLN